MGRVVINRAAGPALELMLAPELQRVARLLAGEVREQAPERTRYFKRSIGVTGTTVYSTDPFAHLVEWGSAHNPPYAPFRRSALSLGLRFDPSRV